MADAKYSRIRLRGGLDQLERWSAAAGQADQNAVYEVLFAVCDGSVFWAYLTVDDRRAPGELFVLVRTDTVVKVRLAETDAFDIVYIGAAGEAPGYERGIDRSA
jgi:hypothetical protein